VSQLHLPPVPRRAGGARSHPEQFRARRGLEPDDARWYAAARLTAVEALARQPSPAASWRPLGPFFVPHGQVGGAGARPGVVGPVADLAVDPADPEHLLAGAATGGVWESRDGGRDWQPRTDGQPSLAVGAVAFAPSDPTVAYAGTGAGDALPELGVGLLRSADGGTSWELAGDGDLLGVGFSALLVDPVDPGRLLAATTAGVLLSTDAGATWARRLPGPAWDLSAGPAGEVLAGCRAGLCRSTDAGTTWELVGLPSSPSAFERVAVCAAADGRVAYAFAAGDGVGHLWRREPAGGRFEAVRPPADLQTRQARAGWVAAAGGGDRETLWLGAAGLHRGARGPDGRWSWVDLAHRPAGDRVPAFQRAVAVAGGVVWVAGEGGLYRSADLGRTFEARGAGLAVAEVDHLAGRSGTDAWLLAGAGGLGALRYEGTETWFLVDEGGGPVAADPADPGVCWHARAGSDLVRSGRAGSWGSWSPAGPDDLDGGPEPPLAARAGVVAVGGRGLHVADAGAAGGGPGGRPDGGWVEVDLPGPRRRVTAVAVAGPERLFAGTEDGEVVRVDRTGGRWLPAGRSRPGPGRVAGLAAEPARPGEVWAAVAARSGGGRVWRSTDAGASWTDRGGGLPDVPVNAVAVDPGRPGTVLVAADVGVWRSDDAGAGWRPLAGGLPQAPALALDLPPGSDRVRVGLLGRGVWEAPLAAGTAPSSARLRLRASRADDGRQPPPAGIPDPFGAGPIVWWWHSPDVKVETAPAGTAAAADASPAWFEDDRGVGAAGLVEAGGRVEPGRPARVFVQVHNPGATLVAGGRVRAFATAAAVGAPPAWPGFPAADPPAGGPWWPVGSAAPVDRLGPGRAGLVELTWAVPAGTPTDLTLLAVATADPAAGPHDRGQFGDVPTLGAAPAAAQALKSVTVVSVTRALRLELWAPAGGGRFALAAEPGAAALVEGLVLGHRLAGRARAAGLQPARLADRWRPQLIDLLGRDAALAARLDLAGAFPVPEAPGSGAGPGRPEVWLDGVELDPGDPEPLALLLAGSAVPQTGGGSLLQVDADGRVVGGHTLLVPG
jgi:hypothetical protein